jgi:hypothetical protein
VCDRLLELRDAMSRYAARFDAALLPCDQAEQAVRVAASIEAMAATVKSLAAARAVAGQSWKADGERSPAHHLARTTGVSVGQAADMIDTARRLERLPEVAAAARSGELSAQQASAIADAATADPAAERELVETAKSTSLHELRQECARTKAASAPDLEARRKAIRARRFLRSYTDTDGAWNLRMRDNPEVGAEMMAALEPIRDRLFAAARAEGRHEPSETYAADALVEAVCSAGEPVSKRGGAKVIVRVDLPALLRGYPLDGETCEIAGFGPVAISAVTPVALPQLRGPGVRHGGPLGDRPPHRLGHEPPHGVRPARPIVQPPPRPQDQGGLGPRRRPGHASLRPTRRPPPPPQRPRPTSRLSAQGPCASATRRLAISAACRRAPTLGGSSRAIGRARKTTTPSIPPSPSGGGSRPRRG